MSRPGEDSVQVDEVEVWLEDLSLGGRALIGHLRRRPSRTGDTIDFIYTDSWIGNHAPIRAFALDPQLQLHPGAQHSRTGAAELTGAFVDCSPDRWGKKLMDRREVVAAREGGRKPRSLRAWDYLLGVNDESRMGALRLKTVAGRYLDDHALSAPPMTELRELEAIARRIDSDDIDDERDARWIKRLVAPGASLGGARPKASVRDADGALWLAKFPAADDRHDVGLWEYVAYQLSVRAGIEMPTATPMRLSDLGTTYGVRRFDRTVRGDRRAYASAFTLLDVDDSEGRSYLDLVEVIEMQGVPAAINADLEQLFRRVALNVLIGNRDDHLRNHGFLRELGGWRLAPAFDVNPNPHKDIHVLGIGMEDPSPDTRLLLGDHDYYRLRKPQAQAILDQIREAVRGWQDVARQCGARGVEISAMEAVIDPER